MGNNRGGLIYYDIDEKNTLETSVEVRILGGLMWWVNQDLNLGQPRYERGALTTELLTRI